MREINDKLNIANLSGISELDDSTAARCSGGYIIKFYGDANKGGYIGDQNRHDIQVKPGLDFNEPTARNGGDYIGIVGEPGATYEFTYYVDGLLDENGSLIFGKEAERTVTLTSQGYSNADEQLFKLDAPRGFTGYSIDRIS